MSSSPSPNNDQPDMKLMAPPQPLPVVQSTPDASEFAAQLGTNAQVNLMASLPAMDETSKQEFLWHTHQYLNEYARFGDTKATFAGAIAAALLGALYGAKVHVPLVQAHYSEWSIASWLAVAGGSLLIVSILLSTSTVLPRLRSTQSKGFVFWGGIASYGSLENLRTSFHAQSTHTLNDQMLHHVFDIATKVCVPKYRAVSLCIWALVLGGFLSGASMILQDVPRKAAPASTPTPVSSSSRSAQNSGSRQP
jgi:hypothetical protein